VSPSRFAFGIIWLCAHHADLIDKDEVTYTVDLLRTMNREHEPDCDRRHRDALRSGETVQDFIAIGPEVIICGDFLAADRPGWRFHLQDFVAISTRCSVSSSASSARRAMDRYLLVNSFGDGRLISVSTFRRIMRGCRKLTTDRPPKPREQTGITVDKREQTSLFLLIFSFATYVRDRDRRLVLSGLLRSLVFSKMDSLAAAASAYDGVKNVDR
jgi:hypothetical protein